MNWSSVQGDTAIIAAVVALCVSLIVALEAIKRALNLQTEFAPEGVAYALLADRKSRYRSFRVLKYHLSGFADDELRKILVRAGGIRLTAGGQEVWGLLARNRQYLSNDAIEEAPTTEVAFDRVEQQSQQPQEVRPQQDEPALSQSSEPFERLRAEMKKLTAYECVKPAPGRQ
ncbi:MAG TPA: hypothetical protein VKE72_06660 [Methylocella sp.]|nr:hypothetical protein [Methylocella sp.]